MVIYPLSAAEDLAIRWGVRLVSTMSVALILFLAAISLA